MAFYTYNQNNSGGSFDFDADRGISHYVIVEADGEYEANSRAQDIGLYFNGIESGYDCDCCGDRWYTPYESDESPAIYGRKIVDGKIEDAEDGYRAWKWMSGPEGYIHYKDGRVEAFDY
jgi:hypothetical protein